MLVTATVALHSFFEQNNGMPTTADFNPPNPLQVLSVIFCLSLISQGNTVT